ncbi:ATP-binding cassette domain-containing protein [Usitatibacter palustris]|uniref:Fructose import ATP-binding protein FrcA n=1 Tax=Usitatibacter palustris TaxID=2732487 RepID=A0A6M4H6H1_9PROT|nr:ATP-binding cassette domain-containing protein [Usitatibacter palustris]QJR15231.1 Fructose import ATP-binding protein FrcA [Usitatibacter palustris]
MSPALVEIRSLSKHFGGIQAVDHVNASLHEGEVVGLLGHNGAGKSTLIKILSGVFSPDEGEIVVRGEAKTFASPREARAAGIETIHQTLALAENLDAPANLFLGRELLTPWRTLDSDRMEHEALQVITRVNPNFRDMRKPVRAMSGGQRQTVAIARALHFNAKILIMDEPCAALGPAETRMVLDTILRLKKEGIGIFLISHDMHDVFEVCDRVTVMKNGAVVDTVNVADVTRDEVLAMIIAGEKPRVSRAASQDRP